ncbi:uncharacterized protein SPPG_00429 [Spizellomyces punctatus DAOM BR117]|uniref:Sphingomyelin synthase-like domain-containing protein n=1 Tax=Spizellomyces punctatus (strain DAOM BR117) TaxID=645134 RepID=A0A0L0HUF9_SPIPD|nr:uncharacterized protein SPPG_00429 [Spizellomyces punctatus DAOM BR117]KND04722.1 hypothetical protein SPPG_00429 [Spizellomyces punctatus DAOM BR117]|eukprot:XP_016612761.1 hypothetical protein SPPG_00429 [Spizellomyces punctatus DAOM BR117]
MASLRAIWERHVKPRVKLWRDKRDLGLLGLAVVYFIICIYLVAVANAFADRRNTNTNKPPDQRYVAPDPLLDATNPWYYRVHLPQNLPDTCVLISGVLMVLFAITRGAAAVTLIRRALFIVGSLYLGRVPYMMLTNLPAPYIYCFTPVDSNFGKDTWLLFSGRRVDCGDTFYSGHTIVFGSCLMMYWYHCRHYWITIPVVLFCIFGMLTLVMSSYHYTIDVLGAFVFTFLCWWLFHLAIEVDEIGNHRWWGKVIRWLDYDGHKLIEAKEGRKTLMMAASGRGPIHPEETLPTHVEPGQEMTERRGGDIVEVPRMSLSGVSRGDSPRLSGSLRTRVSNERVSNALSGPVQSVRRPPVTQETVEILIEEIHVSPP